MGQPLPAAKYAATLLHPHLLHIPPVFFHHPSSSFLIICRCSLLHFLLLFILSFPCPSAATFSQSSFSFGIFSSLFSSSGWPRARIPFEDDPRLTTDPDMAVALNNARMDLQVRTCVRLVPRRGEQDYVYFQDMGRNVECWNMFEPYPPKGRILVNAGPSCLEPMRRPHRPKRVFSECDIEYINHLYNCPRRRKPSPICPAGRLIMAKPSELNKSKMGEEGSQPAEGPVVEDNEGEGGRGGGETGSAEFGGGGEITGGYNNEETTTTESSAGWTSSTITGEEGSSTIASIEEGEEKASSSSSQTEEAPLAGAELGIGGGGNGDSRNTEEPLMGGEEELLRGGETTRREEVATTTQMEEETTEREATTTEMEEMTTGAEMLMSTTEMSPSTMGTDEGIMTTTEETTSEQAPQSSSQTTVPPRSSNEDEAETTTTSIDEVATTTASDGRLEEATTESAGILHQSTVVDGHWTSAPDHPPPPPPPPPPPSPLPMIVTMTDAPIMTTTTTIHILPPFTTAVPVVNVHETTEGGERDGHEWSSPAEPDEPPATARSETRQPYPLMMTLITTTTTTTIAPPTPDWVRSVEESFRAGQRLNSGEGADGNNSTNGIGDGGDGWRPLSTVSPPPFPPSSTSMPPHSAGEDSETGRPPAEPMPIRPEKEDKSERSKESGEDEVDEEDAEDGEIKPRKKGKKGEGKKTEIGGNGRTGIELTGRGGIGGGGGNGPMTVIGVIELPPGAAISIREKTKVTKLVEKTKYIGPCGSACNYGGQLVRLYRSFNSNPQITDHFYTTERLEQHLMASQGFLMEPSMGFLGRNQVDPNCSCIRPLYRLYSAFAKDHFLTSNDQEKGIAEALFGYVFERILGYCTKDPGCGAYLPLYRFYNAISKDHFYTADQQEMHYYKTHTELAYGFEKIECYVWQHSSSARGCPALTLDVMDENERRRQDRDDDK